MHRLRKKLLSAFTILIGLVLAVCWYFDLGHRPVEKIPALHGHTLEAVVHQLGAPDATLSYTLGGDFPGGEFRVELWNFYPPGRPENDAVAIRELHWSHARYSVAVRFHQVGGQWIALDTCRWYAGIVF